MSASLEEELGICPRATLEAPSASWDLQAPGTNPISVSASTAIRPNPRCLVVGRQAKAADIRIQHGSISRKHAALYFLDGNCILEDFGSKKGTRVNGQPFQGKRELKEGDVIVFGNVRESTFQVVCTKNSSASEEQKKNTTVDKESKDLLPTDREEEEVVPEEKPEPRAGLMGRAKREAEIAAMMESLEQTPSYQKYVPSENDNAPKSRKSKTSSNPQQQQQETLNEEELDRITQIAKKHKLPIRERMTLSQESERRHLVTCLATDPSGARFIVGTTGNTLRLYDFGGMDRLRMDPFKMIQADEGHVVSDVCYSNTGDRIFVGTGSVQPYVLDRDGAEIIKFVRGDMYVVDQAKTSGHTAAVTGVDWHPLERDILLTSSADGSARLWNLSGKTQFQMLVCDKVFQPKSAKGQRTSVLCVAFHPGGREFAVGTSCGSVQVWNASRVSARPDRAIYDVHGDNKLPVNSVVYSVDGSMLASRSADDTTCKVWDSRRMSRSATPIVVCQGVPTLFEHCNPAFNGNGTIMCVGTSQLAKSGDGKRVEIGRVKFFQIQKQKPSNPMKASDLALDISMSAGVTLAKWHPKLNQIFLGCSDGKVEILFDPQISKKGALLPFAKAGRHTDGLTSLLKSRAPAGSAAVLGPIIAPHALKIGQGTKRKRNADEEDPSKLRQPEAPAAGFKTGTQTGAAVNFTQFVVDSRLGSTKQIAGKDPREELLKYKEGKSYISQAYAGNKEKILAGKTVEQEEEEQERKK